MEQTTSYRNIESILRERKRRILITGASSGDVNMSRLPDEGEEVGVETDFNEYLVAKIISTTNYGNTCHARAVHDVYKRSQGEATLVIRRGESVEFSHSKIYAIHRQ